MFQERIIAENVRQGGSFTSVPMGGWAAAIHRQTDRHIDCSTTDNTGSTAALKYSVNWWKIN
jgi:hypothetical protein